MSPENSTITEHPPLKPRQRAFARELALKPLEDAYEAAGYKRHHGNARRLADELWEHPAFRHELETVQERAKALAGVHLAHIQLELAKLGFANMQDFIRVTEEGGFEIDLSKMTRAQAAAIQEVGYDANGRMKLKLHEKRGALTDLAKIVGGIRDPMADAIAGIGDRLNAALSRVAPAGR